MDHLTELRDIWLSADLSRLPQAGEISRIIRRYRLRHALKSLATVLLALSLAGAMRWVVFAYRSVMLTTRLGEGGFFIALLIIIVFSSGPLRRVSGQKDPGDNAAFVHYLRDEL